MNSKNNVVSAGLIAILLSLTCLAQQPCPYGDPCPIQAFPSFTIEQLAAPVSNSSQVTIVIWVGSDGSMLGYTYTYESPPAGGAVSQCWQYKNGAVGMLPTPGFSCWMNAANQSGQFVGSLSVPPYSTPAYPFFNFDGTFVPMQAPGVTYTATGSGVYASAVDVNDSGAVLVSVISPSTTPPYITGNGFVYSGGQYLQLPSLGNEITQPTRMNQYSDATGSDYAPMYAQFPAFLIPQAAIFSHTGAIQNIGSLIQDPFLAGASSVGLSQGNDINSTGQVTGVVSMAIVPYEDGTIWGTIPFIYDGANMNLIPVADVPVCNPAGGWNAGLSIDDAGDVIGQCSGQFSFATVPFYYTATAKIAANLNSLVVNPPAGLVLNTATFVNKSNGLGQVLASGTMPGQIVPTNPGQTGQSWFLLTPVSSNSATSDTAKFARR